MTTKLTISKARAFDASLRSRCRRLTGKLLHPLRRLRRALPPRLRSRFAALIDSRFLMEFHEVDSCADPRKGHVLMISHDLSLSGAPVLLLQMARILVADGWSILLISFAPGELKDKFLEIGIPVVITRNTGSTLAKALIVLGDSSDIVICNTVVTYQAVEVLSAVKPVLWYLHEVSLLETMLASSISLQRILRRPSMLWAGSELSASIARTHRPDIEVVPYGLDRIGLATPPPDANGLPAQLSVFGSFEPRKGQDLLLASLDYLSENQRAALRINMHGRVLDPTFFASLSSIAAHYPEVTIHGEQLDTGGYRAAMLACDAVVVPSRDDTLPLVSLDALGAARVLICTATTGTAAFIETGVSGYVAREAAPEVIAATLAAALNDRSNWSDVGANGSGVFEDCFSTPAFARRFLTTCDALRAVRENKQ